MAYDDFDIALARKRGAPDPEGNALRANGIIALIDRLLLDEAADRLDEITDPMVRRDLEQQIEFNKTCLCIPREDLMR